MRFFTLAGAMLMTFLAAQSAAAQTVVYDTITNATTAWNTTLGCTLPPPQLGTTFLAGDNFITSPAPGVPWPEVHICEADVVFVAYAAGTYNVTLSLYDYQCLYYVRNSVSGSVTLNTPGIYVFAFGLPPSIGLTGDPASHPFFTRPGAGGLSVETDSDNLVAAFDNSAPTVGTDSNWFSLDTNCNRTLEPCADEWYTFDALWTHANMLIALYTNCPGTHEKAKGSSAAQVISVRKIDLPAKRAPKRFTATNLLPKII